MGVDVERFETNLIDEELICSICNEVLDKPIMIDLCEHTYCGQCIHEWMKRKKICPQDRKPINERQLVGIPRFMRNQLKALRLKCIYETKGCEHTTSLDFIEAHEKECIYNEINTRISRKVENLSFSTSHLEPSVKYKYRFQYEVIRTSMKEDMRKRAIMVAKETLYVCGRVDFGQIAAYFTTHFEPEDKKFWHCVAGNDFDCYLTATQYYITIKIDGIFIIAFKTK